MGDATGTPSNRLARPKAPRASWTRMALPTASGGAPRGRTRDLALA